MNCYLINMYFSSISNLLKNQKTPRKYGGKDILYPLEIKLINTVFKNSGLNSVELAKVLGITKGAISQYGEKLESKGLIERYFKKDNRKEKYYKLTDNGKKIQQSYERYYKKGNQEICEYIRNLTNNERRTIVNFLKQVNKIPITTFKCDNNICKF